MADIINNNIYGGAIIPSSFVFDFVHYGPYNTLTGNDDWKSMTIGRHCLIKYCNYAFTTEERKHLESGIRNPMAGAVLWEIRNGDEVVSYITLNGNPEDAKSLAYMGDRYNDCFKVDGNKSYDGLIVQKTKDGPLMIGYTNHGLSTEYADSQFARDFQDALDRIDSAAYNLEQAVTNVNVLSNTIGTPSDDSNETIYARIEQIETNITDTNTNVDSNKTKIADLEEKVSSVEETIDQDLTQHITDFNNRTTWKEGETLSLGTVVPTEDTPGRITVYGDNIYYNQQILSRDSWFNKAETAGAKYGAFPQVQVEGTDGYSSPNVPVKICIGSTAPVSTVNDITIWIKTSN